MDDKLTTATASSEDRELLNKATEILDLLKTAYELKWSLVLSPDKMKMLIDILENAELTKVRQR